MVATLVESSGPSPAAAGLEPAELSIVVPTFNESANVGELVARLARVLDGLAWELVFVDDDSPDGTASALRSLARRNARARVVQRIGRRGLSSACVEGMLATAAPYVAVMDADLQHDESLLPAMPATRLAQRVLPASIADPMSGYFMLRREVLEARVRELSGIGFKILLDLLTASGPPVRVLELSYLFEHVTGWAVAGVAGILVGAVWNYSVTGACTWGGRRPRAS